MDGLVSRRQLSLDLALSLLARVREEAEARDLSLAAAVVDTAGHEFSESTQPLGFD